MRTAIHGFAIAMCVVPAAAEAPHRWQHYDLGSIANARVSADVRIPTGDVFGQVRVIFHITASDGSIESFSREINLSTADRTRVVAADFVGLGRKQIFVSAAHGAVVNEILDFDGKRIVTIYTDAGGRVEARPFKRGKRWFIQEDWPRQQWNDHRGMGVGVQQPLNMIRRTLRWNGTEFVPEKPCLSRTISKR